jgi:cytohesin
MINTKKLRQAIKAADIKKVTEILRDDPKGKTRLYGGFTPLHVAVKGGNKDVVEVILDAGADINATTEKHETPLDLAQRYGHKSVADLLRKRGGDPAAKLSLHSAATAGDIKAVRKHVHAGADINQVVNGELPLCLALQYRHWDVAKYLLKKKPDVTKPQKWDTTPLHLAASHAAPEDIFATLLKLGAPIDPLDSYHRTPLCCAAEAGDQEIVDWLLEHGANLTFGREDSTTPVYCALREEHTELASYLIDRGGKSTLHQAIQCNNLARARQKLNAGADVNHEEDPHVINTPLETAIWQDETEMVELLLQFGADPNQQSESHHSQRYGMLGGNTPLHNAVKKGSAKMVKLLLAHGADPDITNASGVNAIDLAEQRNHTHLARLMEAHIDKKLSLAATTTDIEPLYTVHKVAELLSVDDTFVLDLIKTHKITGLQLDQKTLRIAAGSVQRYLAKLASSAKHP